VPTYRRLEHLPGVLRSLEAQDYPDLDVLISDNGLLGNDLDDVVEEHLDRPHRIRRTGETLPIEEHFDALTREAEGEYFLLLCDDDQLGPRAVSALVAAMEEDPGIRVALPHVRTLDRDGEIREPERRGAEPPRRMDDLEFLRIWCTTEYDFVCFVTNLARTSEIRDVGGYPAFTRGNWIDNGLLVKLVLGGEVAYVPEAEFRYRVYEESTGLAVDYRQLASAAREFLEFLESDPTLRAYARENPERWSEARALLERMTWGTYRHRWKNLYYDRLSRPEWVRAAFAMPWIPAYYRSVLPYLGRRALAFAKRGLRSAAGSASSP
jgi:GT2 family glycosyltransferase